jgi:transposase
MEKSLGDATSRLAKVERYRKPHPPVVSLYAQGRQARGAVAEGTMGAEWILGIDVAKATLHVCLLRPDEKRRTKRFANDPDGHGTLVQWIARHAPTPVHACLEATGGYEDASATALADAGHRVSVVNPAAVKAFAQSQLRRTKTDAVDAAVIADFCRAHQPPAWTPWPVEVRALQALVRRRDAVQEMLTQERNRQHAPTLVAPVAASLERLIATLEAELADLDQQIREHLDTHPTLRAQRDLLLTIPGLGVSTVARLLAECRSITAFESARAYAAFAGLVPRDRQSGLVRRPARLSKLGSAHLRQALYFPALAAMRCNPLLRPFSRRLRATGKHKMVVVAAVMRKLLHMVYGVLKHRREFNPAVLNA